MIDFFMLFKTMDWILAGLMVFILVRVVVAFTCSEEVNDYMIIFDIAFLCFLLTVIYFDSSIQRYIKPTEHQRLNKEAVEYFTYLPINEVSSIKSGDVLEYGCSVCPYVVSNEAHLFSDTDTVITETVVKWLISGNTEVKDREYVSTFRNFIPNKYFSVK